MIICHTKARILKLWSYKENCHVLGGNFKKYIPEKSLKPREGKATRRDFERIEEVHFLKYF